MTISINGALYSDSTVCNSGKWSLDINAQPNMDGVVTVQATVSKSNFRVSYEPLNIEKDTLVPSVSFFSDMSFGSLTKSPILEWGGVADAGSGVSMYEIALGSSPGSVDISDWTKITDLSKSSFSFDSLSLVNGSVYFPSFRVTDKAGNIKINSDVKGFRSVSQWKDQTPYSNKNYINRTAVYFLKIFFNDKTIVYGQAGRDSGTYLGYSKLGYFDKDGVLINPIEISQIKNPQFVLK